MKTAEKFREDIIKKICGENAELGVDYIDWHNENGECGLTIKTKEGSFDMIIKNNEQMEENTMKNKFECRMNAKVMKHMALFASRVSESVMWNWDDAYKATHVKEALESLQKSIADAINITDLSESELAELGFMKWKHNVFDLNPIMLIPHYILPVIPKGTEVFCIDGTKKIIGVDEINDDTRVGCIAYGIKSKK